MISSVRRDRREAGLLERVADVGDDVGVLDLLEREVHAHPERLAVGSLQAPGMAAAFAEDPAPDRDDQPGLLGDRDEVDRAR